MALQKVDVLALGRSSLIDNSNAAIIFSSNNPVALWSSGVTYAQYNVVEYSGRMYRSKIASNLANQPDINPNDWETLYIGPKDGDIAYVVAGTGSTVEQRVNGIWADLAGQPATVALVDGQATPADAFVFLGSNKSYADVKYTLRRGVGQGQKREGNYQVLNDNTSVIEYAHGPYTDIGADVGVTITWIISGGNVHMQYTSVSQSQAIELKYTLKGWS